MVQITESDMQQDHARWRRDYAGWLYDVELWEARHDEAMAELKRLFAFIQALQCAVRSHRESIAAYEDLCRRHVEEMAGGDAETSDEAMAFAHTQVAANHVNMRDAHEQIRKNHGLAAARLRNLIAVIDGKGASRQRLGFGGRRYCAS